MAPACTRSLPHTMGSSLASSMLYTGRKSCVGMWQSEPRCRNGVRHRRDNCCGNSCRVAFTSGVRWTARRSAIASKGEAAVGRFFSELVRVKNFGVPKGTINLLTPALEHVAIPFSGEITVAAGGPSARLFFPAAYSRRSSARQRHGSSPN